MDINISPNPPSSSPPREFYYIQMEKHARQALSDGIKTSDEIVVTLESELIRVLNMHYNRNNHLEVGWALFCLFLFLFLYLRRHAIH